MARSLRGGKGEKGGGGGRESGKGQPSAEAFKPSNTDPVPSLEKKARKKKKKKETILMTAY